ncbi:MAG: hypothetical protein QM504_11040 [Pseudomonadota bacterium]
MNNFPQPPIDSMAGLASFKFVEVEGVSNIPRSVNHIISTAISLVVNYAWFDGYSAIDALEYSEPGKQSEHGSFTAAQLLGFVAYSPEILQLFVKMDSRRFVLHLIDNDGYERIAGTIEQPLTFSCDFETQTVRGVKGYKYSFTGLLETRAPIYLLPTGSSSSTSGGGSSA